MSRTDSLLIVEPFLHFTDVTAYSTTLPLLLRHSSFSNPSFASPTSQALHLRHLASSPCRSCKLCVASAYLVMVRYSLEQRVFIYNSYIRKKSIKKCRGKFRRQFPGLSVGYLTNRRYKTGTLLDKQHVVLKKYLQRRN